MVVIVVVMGGGDVHLNEGLHLKVNSGRGEFSWLACAGVCE